MKIYQKLEIQISKIQAEIDKQSSNYDILQKLLEEKTEVEKNLEFKMERWVYLNNLAEEMGL